MKVIVCLGDSITSEWEEPHYPTYWQKLLNKAHGLNAYKVISAGVNGNTARDGLKRLDRDVLAYHPNVVTVMFGHNDLYCGFSPQEFIENMDAIIQKLKSAEIKDVRLLTPNKVFGETNQKQYVPYLSALNICAQSHHLPLIDVWHSAFRGYELSKLYTYTFEDLSPDYLHPNEIGHRLIAVYLMAHLLPF